MKYEEAIEALEMGGGLEIGGKPKRVAMFFEAIELAIEALEKQIPKKPYIQQVKLDDCEQDCMECPNCDSFLGYAFECKEEHYQDNYCKHCGQLLNWSE